MKIVITTQYLENYGAHDWDGKGQCPQYWKSKGGDVYLVENLTQEQADEFIQNKLTQLYSMIEYNHEAAQEYVTSSQVVGDSDVTHDAWEIPNVVTMVENNFIVSRISKNDEYGYMHKKVSEKHESYVMMVEGGRENYDVQYILTTGEKVNHKNIMEYLQ